MESTIHPEKRTVGYFCYLSRGGYPKDSYNTFQRIFIFCQNTNFLAFSENFNFTYNAYVRFTCMYTSRVDNFFFGIGILENCVVECCKREIAKKLAKKGCLKNP